MNKFFYFLFIYIFFIFNFSFIFLIVRGGGWYIVYIYTDHKMIFDESILSVIIKIIKVSLPISIVVYFFMPIRKV